MHGMDFTKMLAVYDEAIKLQGNKQLSDLQMSMLLQDAETKAGLRLKNTEMIPLMAMVAKGRTEPAKYRDRLVNPPE